MPIIKTTCTRDCPDACGLHVKVEGGRATSIRGAPEHPITKGFVCYKQRYFLDRVYGKRRVKSPLLREDAGWRELDWKQAIGLLAGRIDMVLDRSGPLSLFHYQGSGSLSATKLLNRRFFNLIGGSTFATGSLCGGAGMAGQRLDFGARTAHDPLDLVNSKMIIIWGRNPAATNIHQMGLIREAKSRGATVALIDPLPTETARYADYHLKPSPGTDVFLALAIGAALIEMRLVDLDFVSEYTDGFAAYESMINKYSIDWLSRRCDVPAIQIEEVAIEYGRIKPATILLGWGPQRYAWGGETFRLIDALGALTANLGVSGGGVNYDMDSARHFDASLKGDDGRVTARRDISKARLGMELPLCDPRVDVGIVCGANPAVQSLDARETAQALSDIGFLAVIDYEMTETAKLADLVLPSTTFLEENDVVGSFFHHHVGCVNRAIDPVGDSKSDLEIFQLVAEKLGVSGLEGSTNEWIDRLLRPVEDDGITRQALSKRTWIRTSEPCVPFEGGRFPTSSGRFNYVSEVPQVWGFDSDYPLVLLSTHAREWLHSEMTEEQLNAPLVLKISPATASSAGLQEGDLAKVSSRSGSFRAVVKLDERVRDDTIACLQGRPLPDGPNASTAQIISNIGENACYYQTRVKLERLRPTTDRRPP
ncbi:MAG: molybdopterin-dependent oxidoreductase [Actinobacteria bacterium]|nr:molybdopterin-dependent oxidoreductase [Actinomycetota bacterium]